MVYKFSCRKTLECNALSLRAELGKNKCSKQINTPKRTYNDFLAYDAIRREMDLILPPEAKTSILLKWNS